MDEPREFRPSHEQRDPLSGLLLELLHYGEAAAGNRGVGEAIRRHLTAVVILNCEVLHGGSRVRPLHG
jgi:hypothetical protein